MTTTIAALSKCGLKAVFTSLILVTAPANAAWPEKPVRIVVPSSPGGSADAVARLVSDRLGRVLGQSVVVENKGGGGGNIAADSVARAKPDGYTLLLTGNNHTLNTFLFNPPPYQLDDFVAVIELTRGPSVFVAANNATFQTLNDLISQAKADPGAIAYGSPGIGLPSHVAFELFRQATQTSLIHAPYKGSGPSLSDAMGGQIPVVTATLAAAMPAINSGKLKALAVTSTQRWASAPDVPTVQEIIGQPFQHLTWLGIFAPKGTEGEIVTRLNTEINKILHDPAVQETLETLGTKPVGGSADSFQKMLDEETTMSKQLVERAGLRSE